MPKYKLNTHEIGAFLKEKRLEKNIYQKDIAKKYEVAKSRISSIENGDGAGRLLTIEILGNLCNELDINIREAVDIIYYDKEDRSKLLIEDEAINSQFNVCNAVVNKDTLSIINFLYEMTRGLLAKNDSCNCNENHNNTELETTRPERDYC